ncbi:MAG: hypothetical protein AAFP84_18935, partial [Actinomycetota bacterium]
MAVADDKLPIKMLNDRVLVRISDEGERKSSGGILIPATAQMNKRLVWATLAEHDVVLALDFDLVAV